MKKYSIIISDPKVQYWFNLLYDEAKLSKTIESLARDHMDEVQYDFFKKLFQSNEMTQDYFFRNLNEDTRKNFIKLKQLYESDLKDKYNKKS